MQKRMFNDRYGHTQMVIEGRKTMMRQLINPMPKDCATVHKNCWGADWSDEPMSLVVDRDTGGIYCKYCGNGVRLYDGGYHYKTKYKVGEVVAVAQSYERIGLNPNHYIWLPDLDAFQLISTVKGWRNKMYVRAGLMPHQIRITGIRCERLQDISDEDCMKEGVLEHPYRGYMVDGIVYKNSKDKEYNGSLQIFDTPREAFAVLIDKVSGRGTWKSNPWVVVYEFELVK